MVAMMRILVESIYSLNGLDLATSALALVPYLRLDLELANPLE